MKKVMNSILSEIDHLYHLYKMRKISPFELLASFKSSNALKTAEESSTNLSN